MMGKEIEILALLYEKGELKVSEISKILEISTNKVKRLIDLLQKEYSFNIVFDKKKKTYSLVQSVLEKYSLDYQFWASVLIYIFYIFSKSDNQKLKNLAMLLLGSFIKFCRDKNINAFDKYFDVDLLFMFNEATLFYVKEMDYGLFIKIKNAIQNRSEVRITVVDRLGGGFKRINIFPLHLVFLRNNWYLVSFADNEYHVFNMDDIREIFLTGRVMEEGMEFSVEDAIPEIREYIIPSKKYNIKLDITDYFKVYGIGFLHPSQKISKDKDRIIMDLEVANLAILFRWLSSFGKLIKIIEPEIVKQKYIDYLMSLVEDYN